MQEQILCIGLAIILCITVFVVMNLLAGRREGMTNSTTATSSWPAPAVAANAAQLASTVKSQVVLLQDNQLVSKYQSDYEQVILNLDDYLNLLMLQTASQITVDGTVASALPTLKVLNELSQAKNSLNSLMRYVDSSGS